MAAPVLTRLADRLGLPTVRDDDTRSTAVSRAGYAAVLRDGPFLGVVAVVLVLAPSTLVPTLIMAVYIGVALDAPVWIAGALLTLNTTMIACTQTSVTRVIEHRDRTVVVALGIALGPMSRQ